MAYLYLFGAIIFEVTATLLLPLSKNFTKPFMSIGILISYSISFYLLTFAIKGIPIAIAYSTWAALGILLITLFGFVFYHQSINWQSLVGLILIILGVTIVNIFKNPSTH